jgi:hypothetical protein
VASTVSFSDLLTFGSTPSPTGNWQKWGRDRTLDNLAPRHTAAAVDSKARHSAKHALVRKWKGRLQWAPKEVDVYRQVPCRAVPPRPRPSHALSNTNPTSPTPHPSLVPLPPPSYPHKRANR